MNLRIRALLSVSVCACLLLVVPLVVPAVSACGGNAVTTTIPAGTTTSLATTTTTHPATTTTAHPATTTTAGPTTTSISEAAKLEAYRTGMKSLWADHGPKMKAATGTAGAIFDSSDLTSITDAQIKALADAFVAVEASTRAFTEDLGGLDPPKALASAHDTYLKSYRSMIIIASQFSDAIARFEETRNVSALKVAASQMADAADLEGKAVSPAERTLEATLGFALDPVDSWDELYPAEPLPSEHYSGPMVLDPPTGRFIMFGGQPWSATWAYDAKTNAWSRLGAAGGPLARSFYAMDYDAAGKKMILYGGGVFTSTEGNITYFKDTWAFDPAADTWTDLKPSGALPPARIGAVLLADPVSGKLILFGGIDQKYLYSDTWSYDPSGNKWSEVKSRGSWPAVRGFPAVAYDPVRKVMIMFGGLGVSSVLNDTWSYNPAAKRWTKLKPSGTIPPARLGAAMAYDPIGKRLLLYGGQGSNQDYLEDTWAYDPVANAWAQVDTGYSDPPARSGAAMVFDPATGELLLYGGYDSAKVWTDTWRFYPGE